MILFNNGRVAKQVVVLFILFFLMKNAIAESLDVCQGNTVFNVGAGRHDITGPAAEEGMMGYGMLQQQTAGILQRLWARAFIIESPCNGKRIVFVNADLGQVFQGVKQQVILKLQKKYGNLYSDDNVLITATHTHSGPGGYSTYAFYNITTLGFSRENFNTIIDGIIDAISAAQENMHAAQIKLAVGQLPGISYNRSPTSYLLNPSTERAKYKSDIDTEMLLVRFDTQDGKPIGLINWFPIHGVSMNNKNHLINGDNKGYAEYYIEKDLSPSFIAAFAQANAGDVSPNPYGYEGGQGDAGLVAIEKAGKPQYEKAKELFNTADKVVTGGIDYRHAFVEMDKVTIAPAYTHGQQQTTCPAAIGVSMLAGTQDGEGIGWQGISCPTMIKIPFLHLICEMVTTPCQGVKPIALQTGLMKPYPWTPPILPLQVFKLGNLIIVGAPFELTTMTGRRIKEAVARQIPSHFHIALSALANAYAGYVATKEEYAAQRYEAASTHFGPWTEAALEQEFAKLTKALLQGTTVAQGPMPSDLSQSQIDLQPGVWIDDKPLGKEFGAIYQDAKAFYKPGDKVSVIFWGGHPKNNYRTTPPQNSFLSVQQQRNGNWLTIRNDNDWDTTYYWQRRGFTYSLITIEWRIPSDMPPGEYRIAHFGDRKALSGRIYPYVGYSSTFTIG